ncbi:MAG: type I-E CRISPR-associated endonuclease Cas1e [Christensenella sp.]|nr:type I-E CRISPR-associated endonuclease Cas1e [Christensenella sp.]
MGADQKHAKPQLGELVQVKDRLSFLYIEHCVVNRQDSAITVTDARGTVHVPAAALGVLLVGPGTNITHRAVELIGDAGTSLLWVGEHGVRYYAHGRPLTHSSGMLMRQAKLVSNEKSRIAVARKMYQLRFPGEDVSTMTMQQLRGREGARIRSVYRRLSKETEIEWNGREYDPDDYAAGNTINMALSAAHACLYGVAHSVIVALGLSVGLGFVHCGHERSFVYDIADLYKAELSIPVAFRIAADEPADIGADVRHAMRDIIFESHIIERTVKDIGYLLSFEEIPLEPIDVELLSLWDEKNESVPAGVSYKTEECTEDNSLQAGYGKILKE